VTADGHPGERHYKSDLIWDCDGGKGPYLKERLMCSGFDAKPKDARKCLIKNESDRIETWLNANIKDTNP
jgi:hypothetical protein